MVIANALLLPQPRPPAAAPPSAASDGDTYRRLPSRTAVLRNLDSCSSMAELRQRHSLLVRLGLSHDNHAAARLLRFCALHSSGDPAYALRLLLHLPSPDAFLFNTLLRSSSAAAGDHLPIYELMLRSSVSPNDFTFPALLTSITAARSPIAGEQVHAHIFKLGFHHHRFSQNALITMYGSCGRASLARQVFDEMPHRDVVSWTSMAGGYAACAQVDDARAMFDQMPEKNSVSWNTMAAAYLRNGRLREALELVDGMAELDKFTAATVLAAAAEASAGSRGRRIHARIVGAGVRVDAKLAAAIVDMYCKCGCLEEAMEVFHGLEEKQRGLSCWNAMIGGLAAHGRGAAAMELFQKMEEAAAVAPDRITFLGVLTACAHAGLVDEGRRLFARMQAYAVAPAMEHYGCLVDLYARSGMMAEAEEVIAGMVKAALPDAAVVGALAGACRTHGELELGERWGWRAVELEPHNAGRYVLVANLYARAGRWETAARVRKLMGERGVEKEPGRSVVEAGGAAAVGEFVAGDTSHPNSGEIYAKVEEMMARIHREGYSPEMAEVLHEVAEEERERPLVYHSEKLAMAFGLINSAAGETIRVSKNLRICRDCHAAAKLISATYHREIILRDRLRFHHFKDGACSCSDFW